jgi:hypothetical protein
MPFLAQRNKHDIQYEEPLRKKRRGLKAPAVCQPPGHDAQIGNNAKNDGDVCAVEVIPPWNPSNSWGFVHRAPLSSRY